MTRLLGLLRHRQRRVEDRVKGQRAVAANRFARLDRGLLSFASCPPSPAVPVPLLLESEADRAEKTQKCKVQICELPARPSARSDVLLSGRQASCKTTAGGALLCGAEQAFAHTEAKMIAVRGGVGKRQPV
jgi:hypothetical protein